MNKQTIINDFPGYVAHIKPSTEIGTSEFIIKYYNVTQDTHAIYTSRGMTVWHVMSQMTKEITDDFQIIGWTMKIKSNKK